MQSESMLAGYHVKKHHLLYHIHAPRVTTWVSDIVLLVSSEVGKFIQERPQGGMVLTFSPYWTHLSYPFLQYQIHFVVKREPAGIVTDEGVERRRMGLWSQVIFWKLIL